MLRRRRKQLAALVGVIVAGALLGAGALLIPAWTARYRASQVLHAVRSLQPGVDTFSEVQARLRSVSMYEEPQRLETTAEHPEATSFTFYNSSQPVIRAVHFLPITWAQRLILPSTLFQVTLSYNIDKLSALHLAEMQEDIDGGPHPNAATVTIVSEHLKQNRYPVPADYNGYASYCRSSGALDTSGKLTTFTCCHDRFITLDERAAPTQRAAAFNFQLHCLTSWRRCKNDRELLP